MKWSYVAAGDFDVYLLAQSWAPHFCCQHADRCHTVPWAFSARNLSLHGLWPNYDPLKHLGYEWPQYCNVTGHPDGGVWEFAKCVQNIDSTHR